MKYNNLNKHPRTSSRDQFQTLNRQMTESELHQNLQFFHQNIRNNLDFLGLSLRQEIALFFEDSKFVFTLEKCFI